MYQKFHYMEVLNSYEENYNKTLKFYASWNGSTQPAVVATGNIPFDFVANREYLVTLEKEQFMNKITIIDTVTRRSASLEYDNQLVEYSNFAGKQWGAPGILFLSGSITVKRFDFIAKWAHGMWVCY